MKLFRELTIFCASSIAFACMSFGQTAPIADHHTHIWSINASSFVTDPLPKAVQLPPELDQLLRDKERLSKLKTVEAIKPIYTNDLVVLDPGGPYWLRGAEALNYIAGSTIINRLIPNVFEINGNSGFIGGMEVSMTSTADKIEPLSDFLYMIKKGADGKWRVSVETFTMNPPPTPSEVSAAQLIAGLDAADVKKAAVLSVAYWFGNPRRTVEDAYSKVKAENDWVAEQTAKYPGRLYAFFSINPLADYAVQEVERCAKSGKFAGMKLHIGNSRIDMLNPDHVAKLKAVFAAANRYKVPIVIHLWTSDPKYGAAHSRAFLEQILPSAPEIPIQIAHMAASGPGYHSDDAMEVFALAAERKDQRMKNVYFDVASMVIATSPQTILDLVAKRLRQVGMSKVLFGTDWVPGRNNESPSQGWQSFRRLPLTEEEFRTVAGNVAPYLR